MDRQFDSSCLEPHWIAAEALERLWMGNGRFRTGQTRSRQVDSQRRRELAVEQRPFAIVLTCADSRVAPEILFDQGLGDLFVIRVAGNVVNTSVLGSIEYAVHAFDVKCVVVLGHDFCGSVQAVLDAYRKENSGESTEMLLNFVSLAASIRIGTHLPQDPLEASRQAVRHNLFHQTKALTRKSAYLAQKAESCELCVTPALYHLETGEVEWFRGADSPKKRWTPND